MMTTSSVSASTTWGSNNNSSSNINNNSNKRRSSVAATASAVDAYAQSILESHSSPGHEPDDSLGSYVTSLIRHGNTDTKTAVAVRALPEFDSLVELIQEHCSIGPEQAESVLEQIATAVQTGEIPSNNPTGAIAARQPQQHHCTTEDLIQSMNLLSTSVEGEESFNNKDQLRTSSTTSAATRTPDSDGGDDHDDHGGSSAVGHPLLTHETSAGTTSSSIGGMISPIRADNLIPIDLMGALDDPSTPKAGSCLISVARATTSAQLMPVLPPPPPPPPPSPNKSSQKILTSQEERQRLAQDIAASLFQPTTARSRQSSIDESRVYAASGNTTNTASPNNLSPNLSPNLHAVTPGASSGNLYHHDHHDANTYCQEQQQQQHEWNMIMDMLLTMNPEISEDAASAAAYMSSTYILAQQQQYQQHYYDVNVAQYLIDCATSAPPVCRHLLHDGCYRSDCTYSHDIDGHVCLFWLRGRCRGGESCRFLHGFDETVLKDIDPSLLLDPSHAGETTTSTTVNAMAYGDAQDHQESSVYDDTYGISYGLPPPAAAADASFYPPISSAWKSEAPGPRTATTTTSFANIASQGYQTAASFSPSPAFAAPTANLLSSSATPAAAISSSSSTRKVDIPQDLWNAHENRESSVFYIADPIERYHAVSAASSSTTTTTSAQQQRNNVIDLHFQSTKTFGVVLEAILPTKLEQHLLLLQPQQDYHKSGSTARTPPGVWIVTGTGHHVGPKTHQKGGGALEQAVMEWLMEHGYDFLRGRDRNGQGGAVLVTSKRKTYIT